MTGSTDDTPSGKRRDEGWDETVLVWNASVARIPAPAVQPGSAPASPASKAALRRIAERAAQHQSDARTRIGDDPFSRSGPAEAGPEWCRTMLLLLR
jgi:hypothetical protein